MKSMWILATITVIAGCGDGSYSDQESRLIKFVEKNPTGSTDYWLLSYGPFGSSRVGLIFGYPDDGGFCHDLVDMLNKDYPNRFFCERAN